MTDATTNAPTFADLGLPDFLLATLDEVGYESPSPIQARTIPPLLEGRDLIGQAQTGTGKTAAFALPFLARLDPKKKVPQALVLAPTRELAIQVAEAVRRYAGKMEGFHVVPVYGGQPIERQMKLLARGAHVVVGTPGRILDHLRRGTLALEQVASLVLDEADEMLRMGFLEDVEQILESIPGEKQTALFSATMPAPIRRIAQAAMRDPVEIKIETGAAEAAKVRQRYWVVRGVHKLDALTRMLEAEPFDGMLIFVRTKTQTVSLAEKLEARGFSVAPLNGDIPQEHRELTVDRLKRGKIDIIVATDVAARGLDIERVSHVVNFDVPYDAESYVHRIGRTGRAGRAGEAILFVSPRERRALRAIEEATGVEIEPMVLPTTGEVNVRRVQRFKMRIAETLQSEDLSFYAGLVAEFARESGRDPLDVAAALARMVQGSRPLLLDESEDPMTSRGEKGKGKAPRRERRGGPDADLARYRIEVGRNHGATPGRIVGAITNEAGLEGADIGRVEILPFHSTVDLPRDLPPALLQILARARIGKREFRISNLGPAGGERHGAPGGRKPFHKDRRPGPPKHRAKRPRG